MTSRAIDWLIRQYRFVLSRMQVGEFLRSHPSIVGAVDLLRKRKEQLQRRIFPRLTVDTLESRVMLSGDRQMLFVDADGASHVDYRGPVVMADLHVKPFAAPRALAGKERDILALLTQQLNAASSGANVDFTFIRPARGAYSTIYLGGDGSEFSTWGHYFGLAEKIDQGNRDPSDNALVFADTISAKLDSVRAVAQQLAEVILHEAGHLLGQEHDHAPAADAGPLAAVAFDPKVHVAVGNEVLNDVVADGKVTINGQDYTVHPKVVAALTNYPQFYNAGVVGPDGFADSIMGQFVVHAKEHADWTARILDMAWQAQNDSSFSAVEKSQILAFAYGFLTHSTGDHWAHTLVNDFAEGIAPGFVAAGASIPTDQRDLANMLRHLMVEAYITDSLEGVDMNPDRSEVTPGGDISDDSTPGIAYDAPIRFIYESLIRAFPEDPTTLAEVKWDGASLAATTLNNSFVRVSTSIAGAAKQLIGDEFKVGTKITVSGFTNPANNGDFIVTASNDDVLISTITVDRPLVDEIANTDVKIVVHVPVSAVTTMNVDAANGTFTRTTGSFLAEGFVPGQRFSAYGFNHNFDNFIVESVTATELKVVGKLTAGDEVGNGDERLVVQGDRGPILNTIFTLRDKLYKYAVTRGPKTTGFTDQIATLIDKALKGESVGDSFTGDLLTAYLYQWVDNIDDGVRNWGQFGLGFTRTLFDPQTRRDLQNKIGAKYGADTLANTARAAAEGAVKTYDVLLYALDDPNNDGSTSDSFLTNHLIPMLFGIPKGLGVVLTALKPVEALLNQLLGDAGVDVKPTQTDKTEVNTAENNWFTRQFKSRFNVDFDTFDILKKMYAKMDLKTITIGHPIPIFQPGDREKLDALLGIPADSHLPNDQLNIDNVEFYPGALGRLKDGVHFDKNNFAAFKNAVTMTKLMLLQELPVDGDIPSAHQLSALFTNLIGQNYDFSKLNLNGAHGGNILTATLPGVNDGKPWLESIDGDEVWRTDNRTITRTLFRISTQNGTDTPAQWASAVASGQYEIYATWTANVTQTVPDLSNPFGGPKFISPATNAKYTVLDGATPFTVVSKNQALFATDFEYQGLGYASLGQFNLTSGNVTIKLSNVADGNVVAGPILLKPVGGGPIIMLANFRDPTTLAQVAPITYTDDSSTWTDVVYKTGGGNNPLWESALLRPAFRLLYTDWLNGALQFPDLGDTTSPDPNSTPITKSQRGSFATPFGPNLPSTELQIPILPTVQTFILDRLGNVAGFIHSIETSAPLNIALPGMSKSLAGLLDLSGKFNANVKQPILDYFNTDSTPTFQELFAAVSGQLDGSLDSISAILEFNVDFRKMFQADVGLSLGSQADAVGLNLSGNLSVDASIKFVDKVIDDLPKLTFGIDLTPGIATGDRGYIRVDRMLVSADIHATNVNLGANFGFVSAGIVNGTVDLSAAGTITFIDPNLDGKITLGEISSNPLSALISTNFTGTLTGSLPVQVDAGIGNFGNLNVGSLDFGATDLFDSSTYSFTFNGNFDNLFDASKISFADILAAMNKAIDYLGNLEQFSFLNDKLPLVNRSISDLLDAAQSFSDKVTSLTSSPASSLQSVEHKIEQIFGLPDAAVSLALDTNHAIKLHLDFASIVNTTTPFDFSLADLPGLPPELISLLTLNGSGTVSVDARAVMGLDLGLDLSAAPTPFLYDSSSVSLQALLSASNLNFSVTVLGLGGAIKNGSASLHKMGSNTDRASFTASLVDTNSDHRLYPSDLLTLSTSNVNLALNGAVDVNLPFEFPVGTAVPPPLVISIPNIANFLGGSAGAVNLVSYPDLSSYFAGLNLSGDLASLLGSIDQLLGLLQGGLESGALGEDIPLIGHKLKDGATAIKTFRTELLAKLQPFIANPTNKTIPFVRDALFQCVGPAGLNVLVDGSDPDNVPSESDIGIVMDDPTNPTDVRFMMHLVRAPQTVNVPLGFDLGLPAIGLTASGSVAVTSSFDFQFGVGVSKQPGVGPYIYVGQANELKLNVNVGIPSFTATGRLSFLTVDVNDDVLHPSHFTGNFGFDLASADNRLTLSELSTASFDASLDAAAVADVNLKLKVSYQNQANFPSIYSDLNIDWAFGNASSAGSGAFGSSPQVAFNNVKLDLGTFLSNFAKPILDTIDTALKPLQPLIDLVNMEVPMLAEVDSVRDYFDLNNDDVVTVGEVIHKLDSNAVLSLIDAASAVRELRNAISTVGANTLINLGSFNLNNLGDIRNLSTLANSTPNSSPANTDSQLQSLVPGFNSKLKDTRLGGTSNAGGGGLSFPLIQKPSQVFQLLMGKDLDLFTFTMPKFSASLSIDKDFHVFGPFDVGFFGTVGLEANLAFGYDTSGLRAIANGAPLSKAFDGFYLLDKPTGSSTDPAEIKAFGEIGISAGLDLVLASGEIRGSLRGDLDLNLNDPNNDGKVRYQELKDNLAQGLFCIFDIAGELSAVLSAHASVGIWPLEDSWDAEFAKIQLLDFTHTCDDTGSAANNDPILATDIGGGVLRLNMGPYSGDRVHGDTSDDDEHFSVTRDPNDASMVQVTAFGYSQSFSGITKIYAEGGEGNDVVTIAQGLNVQAEMYGDFKSNNNANGNDQLTAGEGNSVLMGGGGNDALTGRGGADVIFGEAGNDILSGGSNADVLDGADGADQIYGGTGNDTARGGDGNDTIQGNNGDDSILGQGGDDSIYGDSSSRTFILFSTFNDVIYGGDGNDRVYGGFGNDIITGDNGDDSLSGDTGNDVVHGNSGNDVIYGYAGTDYLTGEDGNDTIVGGSENDTISGDNGMDSLEGGSEDDSISGGADADKIIGDSSTDGLAGNDIIAGNDGNDTIAGDNATIGLSGITAISGAGNDVIAGGNGDDVIAGQGGADLITGDVGNDTINGGDGNDKLIGDSTVNGAAGNDSINGDAGNDIIAGDNAIIDAVTLLGGAGADIINGGGDSDQIYGQGGNDTATGGAGTDYIEGNDGADSLSGDADNDTILGQAGADIINGGDDNDSLIGGTENDTMAGGNGADYIEGNDGADSMLGDAGNDTILGLAGADIINGNDDNDSLVGGTENDTMSGGNGADYIEGNDGADSMLGDAGNDTMYGNAGADIMNGGDDADSMYGNADNDTMAGGAGDDEMTGNDGADSMNGDGGNDVMLGDNGTITPLAGQFNPNGSLKKNVVLTASAGDGADAMSGGTDDDNMFGGAGNDNMSGDEGNDCIQGNSGRDLISGGNGEDDLIGGSSDSAVPNVAGRSDDVDTINGDAGHDVIVGDNGRIARRIAAGNTYARQTPGATAGKGVGAENNSIIRDVTLIDASTIGAGDSLSGGTGDDSMFGGLGDDQMFGNDGNDDMIGHQGADRMDGGAGSDGIIGDQGTIVTDLLDSSKTITITTNGKKITETIFAAGTLERYVTLVPSTTDGADSITGGSGDDFIHGGGGNDTASGDDGKDAIFGDAGNDVIKGGNDADHIWGGSGNDDLDGQAGSDIIYGGDGDDRLVADSKDDKLIDWFGNYNTFVVPTASFGSPIIIRSADPSVRDFLLALAGGDGATNADGEAVIVNPPSPSNSGN